MFPENFITYAMIGATTVVLAIITILEESPESDSNLSFLQPNPIEIRETSPALATTTNSMFGEAERTPIGGKRKNKTKKHLYHAKK